MNFRLCVAAAIAVALPATSAMADGIVDGQLGANYGSAIAVQTVQTGFGDNASELNAAYAYQSGSRIYMLLTGNLEQNFNKLNLFFDSKAGGENVLSADPNYDFDSGGGNWISSNYGGMTFDTGFAADYHMIIRSGGGDNYEADFIDRLGGAMSVNGNTGAAVGLGAITSGSLANNAVGSAISNDIGFFFDNSNTAGIGGTAGDMADQAAAQAVTTGFEFSIDVSDLGIDPLSDATIRVAAMIGNGDHNFHSNQILGGLPVGSGNLGGDGSGNFTGDLAGVDFNNFAGNQFVELNFVAVPEPGSFTVLGLAGLLIARRRKR